MAKDKKTSDYISIKESRAIIKDNIKKMKYYEGLKKKNLPIEEYTSYMKDENNIFLAISTNSPKNIHTIFISRIFQHS